MTAFWPHVVWQHIFCQVTCTLISFWNICIVCSGECLMVAALFSPFVAVWVWLGLNWLLWFLHWWGWSCAGPERTASVAVPNAVPAPVQRQQWVQLSGHEDGHPHRLVPSSSSSSCVVKCLVTLVMWRPMPCVLMWPRAVVRTLKSHTQLTQCPVSRYDPVQFSEC